MKQIIYILTLLLLFGCWSEGNNNKNNLSPFEYANFEKPDSLKLYISQIPDSLLKNVHINNLLIKPFFVDSITVRTSVIFGISEKETKYFQEHKENVWTIAFCAHEARDRTSGIVGKNGGPADALRHTFAAACLTKALGQQTATTILRNHEAEENPDPMDMANNATGIQMAIDNPNTTLEDFFAMAQNLLATGKLIYRATPFAPVESVPIPAGIPSPSPTLVITPNEHNGDRPGYSDGKGVNHEVDKPKTEHVDKPKAESKNDNGKIGDGKPTKLP